MNQDIQQSLEELLHVVELNEPQISSLRGKNLEPWGNVLQEVLD